MYDLNISLWSMPNPIEFLEDLFALRDARLVHKGKLITDDPQIQPGMKIMLFGTSKKDPGLKEPGFAVELSHVFRWWRWIWQIFQILYLFLHSLICSNQYSSIPKESYDMEQLQRRRESPFPAPGQVR